MTENISTPSNVVFTTLPEPANGLIAHPPAELNAFLGILISLSVYLLIALLFYGVKESSKNRSYKKALWICCSFNYCQSILHGIVTMIIHNGGISSTATCNVFEILAGE